MTPDYKPALTRQRFLFAAAAALAAFFLWARSPGAVTGAAPAGKAAADAPAQAARPKVAVFPLAGDAKEELRARCAFSLRSKLDRTGKFEVLDGYLMTDLAESADEPVTLESSADDVRKLGEGEGAAVLVWGELKNEAAGATMRLKVLDLREPGAEPREFEKAISDATDLRFVIEQVLETLPGVRKFEHMTEVAVTDDATAAMLWGKNPNLVPNFDFSKAGAWTALYQSQKYPVQVSDSLPAVDAVNIYRDAPAAPGGKPNNVLAMRLSQFCAENAGMACLSDRMEIEPETRYRLKFRYKSDGPTLHVFVKGYTKAENIKGDVVEREVYRRQVPPTGPTNGQWVTVVDDLNPQHVAFPVESLKVDLYAYLSPGVVMFDDVELKAVGGQTRDAKDKAIDKPVDRPGNVLEKEKQMRDREKGKPGAKPAETSRAPAKPAR